MKISEIGICSYNIHGLFKNINSFRYSKLTTPYVQELFEKNKIVGLLETFHEQGDIDELYFDGFICHSKCRPKSKKKGNKPSGGLSVYIHHSIKPGIKFLSRPGSETIWIKLDCDFFDLLSDIYCCFVYAAPSNSPYLRRLGIDAFENLATEISEFVGQGSLCLLGDFNSRTGDGLDFLPEEDNSSHTVRAVPDCLCWEYYTRINLRKNY